MNKKGFTLVELSIVLVIIGLLIGGILAAQSMISTAKIQSTIRQLSQYDVAVTNFQTKYNQLPGDSNLFPGGGNNDGFITPYFGDSFNAWNHLSLGSGLKNYQGNDYQPIDSTNGGTPTEATCPKFNISQDTSIEPCLYIASWGVYSLTPLFVYMYHNGNVDGSGYSAGHWPLKVADTLALDKKIDDGIGNSGNIYGSGNGCINAGGIYDLTKTGYVCAPFIALGITNSSIGN